MKSQVTGGYRVHRRRTVQLEVSITLKNPFTTTQGLTLVGRTKNIGEGGVALVVSASNIDRYLNRKDLPISIRFRLPKGLLEIEARPVHFKRFASAEGDRTYVIGSAFEEGDDLKVLQEFLRSLPAETKSTIPNSN